LVHINGWFYEPAQNTQFAEYNFSIDQLRWNDAEQIQQLRKGTIKTIVVLTFQYKKVHNRTIANAIGGAIPINNNPPG